MFFGTGKFGGSYCLYIKYVDNTTLNATSSEHFLVFRIYSEHFPLFFFFQISCQNLRPTS